MKLKAFGVVLGSLVFLTGCVDRQLSTVGAVNTEPLTIDQAMQTRSNWEPAMAEYENGDTHHNLTGFAYSSDYTLNGYTTDPRWVKYNSYWVDTATFGVNAVTSPYTYYKNYKNGTGNVSTGVQLPPSYTANPPLPPSPDAPAPIATTSVTETNTVVPAEHVESVPATQP